MEQSRKNLKTMSIIVLALAGLTLLNLIFELWFGDLNSASVPEGSPDGTLLAARIILLSISVLMLLPQLYIGMKGLKMAKQPNGSRGHIIWGMILLVLTVISMISPLSAVIGGESVFENVAELLSVAVEVYVLFDYVKYAKIVAKEA